MKRRTLLFYLSVAFLLLACCFSIVITIDAHALEYEEGKLKTDGKLALKFFSVPRGEVEAPAKLSLALWNATPDWPLFVVVDINATYLLDHEGYFVWTWDIIGERHNVIVRSNSTLFLNVTFTVIAPRVAKPPTYGPYSQAEYERLQLYWAFGGFIGGFTGMGILFWWYYRRKEEKVEEVI